MQLKFPENSGHLVFLSEVGDGAMNLSNEKNINSFVKKIRLSSPLSQAQQIHGSKIVKAKAGTVASGADGLFSFDKTPLSVRSADCIPILLCDQKGNFSCAIHSGRRSLLGKIISKSLKKILQKYELNPLDIKVFLGPHIRVKNYSISDLDAKAAEKVGFKKYLYYKNNRKYFDLTSCALGELEKIGISRDNITDCDIDTFKDERFFSSRKGGAKRPAVFMTIFARQDGK